MHKYEQEGQEQPGQSGYQGDPPSYTGYIGSYEIEQQKIQPYSKQESGYAFYIVTIILSSLGFIFTLMCLIASAAGLYAVLDNTIVMGWLVFGLISAILGMLITIAMFVLAVVFLARRVVRRRSLGRVSRRGRELGRLGM